MMIRRKVGCPKNPPEDPGGVYIELGRYEVCQKHLLMEHLSVLFEGKIISVERGLIFKEIA